MESYENNMLDPAGNSPDYNETAQRILEAAAQAHPK